MARQAKPVSGVYEKVERSGVWYIRYRTQGKLVRKKIGTQKQAKDYLDKLKLVRATGDGIVPVTATEPVRTVKEAADLAVVEGSSTTSYGPTLPTRSKSAPPGTPRTEPRGRST